LNKFAPIAFILLLLCGAALWFLASDSLNVHIKNQLQTIGSELTQQNVSVEEVTIRSYQGSGTINKFTISHSISSNNVLINNPIMSITSIDLVINRESLKKEIVIIDELIINGLTASYSHTETGNSLEQLLATVKKNIPNLIINTANKPELAKIMPPRLKIVKVTVKSAALHYIENKDGEKPTITIRNIPMIEWKNADTETGQTGEKIGMQIFEQLLFELAKHSTNLKITH
jgi:hypothetical protein